MIEIVWHRLLLCWVYNLHVSLIPKSAVSKTTWFVRSLANGNSFTWRTKIDDWLPHPFIWKKICHDNMIVSNFSIRRLLMLVNDCILRGYFSLWEFHFASSYHFVSQCWFHFTLTTPMWGLWLCANVSWIKPMNLVGINFFRGYAPAYFVWSLYGKFGLGTWDLRASNHPLYVHCQPTPILTGQLWLKCSCIRSCVWWIWNVKAWSYALVYCPQAQFTLAILQDYTLFILMCSFSSFITVNLWYFHTLMGSISLLVTYAISSQMCIRAKVSVQWN